MAENIPQVANINGKKKWVMIGVGVVLLTLMVTGIVIYVRRKKKNNATSLETDKDSGLKEVKKQPITNTIDKKPIINTLNSVTDSVIKTEETKSGSAPRQVTIKGKNVNVRSSAEILSNNIISQQSYPKVVGTYSATIGDWIEIIDESGNKVYVHKKYATF